MSKLPTAAEVRGILAQPRRSKYGAKPTIVDGVRFASKKEARRWCELKLLERAGKIEDLRRQMPYEFTVNGVVIERARWDFRYHEIGKGIVVEDSKGFETRDSKRKRKWMKALYCIDVRLT